MQYGPKIATNGLTLAFDAADKNSYPGSGTIWKDLSGNKLDASGNASYISYTGAIAGSSWVTSTTDILNTDIHSIFFMIKFNSSATYPSGTTATWEKIFSYSPAGTDRSPGIWRWPSNRWIHWRYDPGNSGTDFGKGSSSLDVSNEFDLNTWYHVGVTKNGANTVMYVNGIQVGTGSVSNPKTAGTSTIIINEYYTNPLNNVNCVQVYNRVLTSSEVYQNYSAIKTRFGL